jgi:hypothetical protein
MLRRTIREPAWQQRVGVGVGIAVVGITIRWRRRVWASAQSPVQSFDGQFCSHAPTVGPATATATALRASSGAAVDRLATVHERFSIEPPDWLVGQPDNVQYRTV